LGTDGATANTNERTFISWLAIIIFIVLAGATAVLFHGTQLSVGWRAAFVVIFGVATVTIALLADVAHVLPDTDRGPFDWYTIAHFSAGLAFGAWFLPLWWVLVVTIAWEVFEATVPGWGLHEPFVNRVMDITVAVCGWFLVAGCGALLTHGQLPFLISPGSVIAS
jgi:hypothetical protein